MKNINNSRDTTELTERPVKAEGVRFAIVENGKELGRATLFLMSNDLHDTPFGLLEDVFVEEQYRGQGIGTKLVQQVIEEAKRRQCYKLLATSRYARPKVHELYERLGFEDHGKEFRMEF